MNTSQPKTRLLHFPLVSAIQGMAWNPRACCLVGICIALLLAWNACFGGEFRSFNPIQGPDQLTPRWDGSAAGFQDSPDIQRILQESRARVPDLARKAVAGIFDAWSKGNVDGLLAEGFYDKSRFLDLLKLDVPRDARVRILAIESIHPLEEVSSVETVPSLILRVRTRLSAVVRTQIEFEDPGRGFRKIQGRNEFILRLNQEIPLTRGEGR